MEIQLSQTDPAARRRLCSVLLLHFLYKFLSPAPVSILQNPSLPLLSFVPLFSPDILFWIYGLHSFSFALLFFSEWGPDLNRHLRHYHWKKVCRYGHAHDRFFALFLLSYLTRVRRAGLEPAFCASLFSSKSCCVFHKHETFFSAQVLPVKLPPYSVIPLGILVHNSSMVSCIFSRSPKGRSSKQMQCSCNKCRSLM